MNSAKNAPPPPPEARIRETPTKNDLLHYLNRNASMLTALDVRDLDLDIHSGSQSFGVSGSLYCEQPRNFRMLAKMPVAGKRVADIGSNNEEFWFWISENKPPDLFHCSYTDLARGVQLPFPVQPEWVMEALGMARYDSTRPGFQLDNFNVEVRREGTGRVFELIEQTTSPQGERVKKVIVFNDYNARGDRPQVTGLRVLNMSDQLLCRATITKVQRDPSGQVTVPYKILLEWPQQQLKLAMTLDGVRLNNPETDLARNPKLFTRPQMSGIRSVDLARAAYDAPPNSLQRTSGIR